MHSWKWTTQTVSVHSSTLCKWVISYSLHMYSVYVSCEGARACMSKDAYMSLNC